MDGKLQGGPAGEQEALGRDIRWKECLCWYLGEPASVGCLCDECVSVSRTQLDQPLSGIHAQLHYWLNLQTQKWQLYQAAPGARQEEILDWPELLKEPCS